MDKQNTSEAYCSSSPKYKHRFELVVTDGRSGLVKCFYCGKTKKIGDGYE